MTEPSSLAPEDIPEWLVLTGEIRSLADELRRDVATAVDRFHGYADVREAIAYRERRVPRLQARVEEINKIVRQLNLIAPSMRFHLRPLVTDEEIRPLARSYYGRRE